VFTSNDLELRDDQREWASVADFMRVRPDRLLLIRQVHGTRVALARRGENGAWQRPEADIILSDDPEAAVGVRVADCAPILLVDPVTGAVGAVHAGWRGAAARASAVAVASMSGAFGTRPADLIAAIGPCLGQCCGEVGPEVVDAFRRTGADDAAIERWFARGCEDRRQLDLAGANRDQLIDSGVNAARIFISGLCTKTSQQYLHSYRARGPEAGRMLGMVRPSAR
jgi:YfiH family protein